MVQVEGRRASQKSMITATFMKKLIEDGFKSLGKMKLVLFCSTYLWLLIVSFRIFKLKLHINLLKCLGLSFSCYFNLSWQRCLFDLNFCKVWHESFWFGDSVGTHSLYVTWLQLYRAWVLQWISADFKDLRWIEEGEVQFYLKRPQE